jgi:hypothetical protein
VQPRDDLSRVVEPAHMGVTGGEIAIRMRQARIFLDREQQFRHGLIEAPADEMRGTYYQERRADAGTGTEAQRGVDVLDRDVGPARPPSKDAADNPTAGVVRLMASARSRSANGGMRANRLVAGFLALPINRAIQVETRFRPAG